jgi:hypothetical protein
LKGSFIKLEKTLLRLPGTHSSFYATCGLWLEERTPEQLKGEDEEWHVQLTGEVKGKEAGNVFVDNAMH